MRTSPPFIPHDASDRAVSRYLQGTSAHSDVVELLWRATQGLTDVTLHCPDPARFAWVIAHVAGRTFAFAIGMHGIGVRLAPADADAARAEGAEPIVELDRWWLLRLYDGPALAGRCGYWVARAHADVSAHGQATA